MTRCFRRLHRHYFLLPIQVEHLVVFSLNAAQSRLAHLLLLVQLHGEQEVTLKMFGLRW